MNGSRYPAAVTRLFLAGWLVLLASCDRAPATGKAPAAEPDLARVPVSPALAPHLTAGRRALDLPLPTGPAARRLRTASRLEAAIQRPVTRHAALDTLRALWRREPTSAVWIELATRYRRFLGRRGAFAEPLASLDTASAAGRFLRGRLATNRKERRRWFRRAVGDTATLGPVDRVIVVLDWIGAERSITGPDSAVARTLRLLPLARSAAGCYLEGRCWGRLARDLKDADRLDDALHAAALAAAMARRCDDRYRLLDRQRRLASLLLAHGDPEAALSLLIRAIQDAEALDYPWGRKKALDDAAAICCELSDYRRAVAFDRQALACNLAEADSLNVPRSLVSLAHDYLMLDRPDSAGACLARAERWISAFPEPRNEAMLPAFTARYRYWIGDTAAADSLLHLCRERLQRLGMESRLADVLLDQLRMGVESGRARLAYAALDHLQRLQPALRDRSLNQNRRADLELLTAAFLTRQGEFAAADSALARARRIVTRRGGEGQRWELARRTGELALARGDTIRAEAAFTRCLELARRERTGEHLTAGRQLLGRLLLATGRGAAVRRLLADTLSSNGLGGRFRTRWSARLLIAASLARDGRHREAVSRLRELARSCPPRSPADLRAALKLELGRSLAALGRTAAARRELTAAVSLLVSAERLPPADTVRPFQDHLLREAVEALLALDTEEMRQGGDSVRVAFSSLLMAERSRWATAGAVAGHDSLTAADLQHLLSEHRPLLVFLVGRERSFAWSAGGDRGLRLAVLPGRGKLEELLAPVLADLARPARPLDPTALAQLAAVVLGPVTDAWPAGTTLSIVPDGILCGVPWAALPWPAAGGTPAHAVLDHGPVVESPSVADLVRSLPSASPDTLSLLAVGRNFGGRDIPALHGAEAEARAVAALWSPGRVTLLTGARADWFAGIQPRLGRCGVLHLATHAVLHHGGAGRTTLRLGAGIDAEPVTAGDVASLHLPATLVFLSGCETAAPSTGAAAGLNDLARAFLVAGAGAVIGSTLPVDDTAAAFLAVRFYRHWLAGNGCPAALQRARQDLRTARAAWRHPYFWAGYRLIGATR